MMNRVRKSATWLASLSVVCTALPAMAAGDVKLNVGVVGSGGNLHMARVELVSNLGFDEVPARAISKVVITEGDAKHSNGTVNLAVTVAGYGEFTVPLSLDAVSNVESGNLLIQLPRGPATTRGSFVTPTLSFTSSADIEGRTVADRAARPRSLARVKGKTISFGPLANLIVDPGFEGGTPNAAWNEVESTFGTPLCDAGSCGVGGGTGPNSGAWWSWFGGTGGNPTVGSVDQDVVIPAGSNTITFFLEIPAASGNGADVLDLLIDGTSVFSVLENAAGFGVYAQVVVDITGFDDGASHNVKFDSVVVAGGSSTNFFVDDVALLEPATPATLGACCDDLAGTCDDCVLTTDCTGMLTRHVSETLCADIMPGCGLVTGACCNPTDGTCSIETPGDCAAANGSFLGVDSACMPNECPCVGSCTGTAEAEAACGVGGDTTNGGCDSPFGVSTCCFANGGVGCDDTACQDAVCLGIGGDGTCAGDGFCCGTAWDGDCATLGFMNTCGAQVQCAALCPTPAATPTFAFGSIMCGETVCGTLADDGTGAEFDEDWYQFDITATRQKVTWSVSSEIEVAILIVSAGAGDCTDEATLAAAVGSGGNVGAGACDSVELAICLDPGTYYAVVIPTGASGAAACGADYSGTLSCETCPTPANDLCADAIPLAIPSQTSEMTTYATPDDPGTCGTSAPDGNSVWYSVQGTGNTITASLCAGTDAAFDTKMQVFCSTCATPVCVDGDDDFCSFFGPSEVSWCSDAAETYLIHVGGFGTGDIGTLVLDLSDDATVCTTASSCVPPDPIAETCAAATVISALPFASTVNNDAAVADGPAGTCDQFGATGMMQNDVWWTWTATTSCIATATAQSDDYPTLMTVRSDCADPFGTEIGCSDDTASGATEAVQWNAVAGTTYYIQVGDSGSFEGGGLTDVTLDCVTVVPTGACCAPAGTCTTTTAIACADNYLGDNVAVDACVPNLCPQPPANDSCAGAVVISTVPFAASDDNALATPDGPGTSCQGAATMQNDIWYSYTPASACILTLFVDYSPVAGTGYDGILGVHSGSCAALFEEDCQDSGFGGDDEDTSSFLLTAGTTYLFQIGDFGGTPGGGATDISVDCVAPPAGGACCTGGVCTDEAGGAGACAGTYAGDGTACATEPPCNDSCMSPTVIGAVPFAASPDNSSATPDGPGTSCQGALTMQNDIWYSYTPAVACTLTLLADYSPIAGTGYDGILGVYTGACGALVESDCQDSGFGGDDEDTSSFALVGGTTYLFQIGDFGGTAGGGGTDISVDCPPLASGANDPPFADDDGDGIPNFCDTPDCGNNVVEGPTDVPAGVEECDNGMANSDTTPDACRTDCTLPVCGDGVNDTGEQCDDGNSNNQDACLGTCLNNVCGDGALYIGVEGCDNGAANSDTEPDACRTDCTPFACGDGVLDTGEMCDDGNTINGDGCSDACEIEGVPTVSTWGLVILALLLLAAGKVYFRRSSVATA